MKHPIQLPIIVFHGLRWFVDYRLQELRQVDTHTYTPLPFRDFDEIANGEECETLAWAIIEYLKARQEAEIE
jgi:hypothetical protein